MQRHTTTAILLFAACALLAASTLNAQNSPSADHRSSHADQSTGDRLTTTPNTSMPGQPSTPDVTTTEGFRMVALMSNSFQLQASDLAAARAKDPAVRDYAQKMIPIHERSTAALTTGPAGGSDPSDAAVVAAASKGGRAPLDAAFQRMLDALTAEHAGPGFDVAFGRAQVEGHRVVIAAYETYLRVGTNEAVKKFVSESLPKMKENAVVAARLPGGDVGR